LERRYPNITNVERNSDGAIKVDAFDGNIDRLLAEIDAHLKKG
jgi:hypothetical protein